MNIFLTSDNHFSHRRLLEVYQPNRGAVWNSIEEMDEGLIERWNSVVKPNDLVYNLGDLSFNRDVDYTVRVLNRLNGTIRFIFGNHDGLVKENINRFAERFEWLKDYYEFRDGNQYVVLSHFPFATWNRAHHGAIHCHGHCHGSYRPAHGKIVDVGTDSDLVTGKYDMRPFALEEVKKFMSTREQYVVDRH